jgi:hypothetical protein
MVNVQAELEHDGSPGVHLCFQKQLAVLQKQLWILEVRSVPGVGIDDQLRVGDMLRHDPRVDRRDHDVIRAIHYEGRLLDHPQFDKTLTLDLTPLQDRRVLSLRGLLRSRRIRNEKS